MELALFIKIGLPISLALIMLSMGLKLGISDFQRVAEQPRALFVGLVAQMLLVPLLAFGLLQIFQLPPLLAVGFMVLSLSPGGTTSNLFSYMARGDVALSVGLTAIASLITPFTIPLLTEAVLQWQLGDDRDVTIPVLLTMKRLLLVTVLPLVIGMLWNRFYHVLSMRVHPWVHRFSTVLFFLVIFSIIAQQWAQLPEFLTRVGMICSIMIIAALLLGYGLARLAGLSKQQQKTVGIEVGMQNGGMALIVTQSVLQNATMSIVPVMYGLLMLIPVLLIVLVSRGVKTT